MFEGNWLNGNLEGWAIEYDDNGKLLYEGHFRENEKCGYGIYYREDGKKLYEGTVVFI